MEVNGLLCSAKKKYGKQWVEGYAVYYPNGYAKNDTAEYLLHDTRTKHPRLHRIEESTLRRFTGITDSAHDKKWEGDVFECADHRYCIEWDNDELCWYATELFEPDYSTRLSEFRPDEIAVIGNKYDHPQLLDGTYQWT